MHKSNFTVDAVDAMPARWRVAARVSHWLICAQVPPVGLEGRELPRPFRCWATTNTEDCFKAFDKRENAPWRSADVGGWAGALTQTQVLTLDVGDGHQLAPTCV